VNETENENTGKIIITIKKSQLKN